MSSGTGRKWSSSENECSQTQWRNAGDAQVTEKLSYRPNNVREPKHDGKSLPDTRSPLIPEGTQRTVQATSRNLSPAVAIGTPPLMGRKANRTLSPHAVDGLDAIVGTRVVSRGVGRKIG